jgi:hypothetical protein
MAAAAVESAALYALHLSDRAHDWPATDPAWSQGLYALAVFAPLTAQLLADRAQRALTWLGVIGIGVAFFCFGREWGSSIDAAGPSPFGQSDNPLPFMFLLAIIWLIALPFLQSKLAAQTWAGDYRDKPPPARDADLAARIVIFPRGRSLDGRLLQALQTEWQSRDNVFQRLPSPSLPIAGIFIDLDGAGVEDFVLLAPNGGIAFRPVAGQWEVLGRVVSDPISMMWKTPLAALPDDRVRAVTPRWKELIVDSQAYRIAQTAR